MRKYGIFLGVIQSMGVKPIFLKYQKCQMFRTLELENYESEQRDTGLLFYLILVKD
jgi:hypothetical protein